MKTSTKTLFIFLASITVFSSMAYAAATTINTVTTQTINTSDIIGIGWFQAANDRLPPAGWNAGQVLLIDTAGKPAWGCGGGAGCTTPPTCTSWTYTPGTCQPNNTQSLTVATSSPSGCTGGTPLTSQACTYVPPVSCTTPTPTGANYGTATIGTPTSANQAWTYSATPGNCTYTCLNGYSGNGCTTPAITGWRLIDTNCNKPDITVGSQVWAGCNSTIGSSYTYTSSSLADTDGVNLYGGMYRYDTMSANSCLWIGISTTNTVCPCKGGYHVPSTDEWDTLSINLWCTGAEKLTGVEFNQECLRSNYKDPNNGFGWASTNPKSLRNFMGLSLPGLCNYGNPYCANRGTEGGYWTSTPYAAYAGYVWERHLYSSVSSYLRSSIAVWIAMSVRCLKD